MLRALRLALMWFLATAIPLQGFAAATMAACGSAHHRMAASAAPHAHVHAAAAHAHEPDEHTGVDTLHQLSKFKCSACAACCVAVALPSPPLTFDSPALANVFASALPRAVAIFLTDGLERPPRVLLA
jgi:hypothetical protein